jgi:hypothetical protein
MREGKARLRVGQMEYPAVVLPSMYTMAPPTFALLREFRAAGGPIVRCGQSPRLLDGKSSSELERWLAALPATTVEALPRHLAEAVPPAVRLSGAPPRQVYAHVRNLDDDGRLVMLVNLDRAEFVSADMTFGGDFPAIEELDLRTGHFAPLAKTELTFAPTKTRVLILQARA